MPRIISVVGGYSILSNASGVLVISVSDTCVVADSGASAPAAQPTAAPAQLLQQAVAGTSHPRDAEGFLRCPNCVPGKPGRYLIRKADGSTEEGACYRCFAHPGRVTDASEKDWAEGQAAARKARLLKRSSQTA